MKKILGYILVAIGGFIGVSLIIQLPEILNDLASEAETKVADPEGYIVGIIIGGIILFAITISMLWFGFKLIKKTNTEPIATSKEK